MGDVDSCRTHFATSTKTLGERADIKAHYSEQSAFKAAPFMCAGNEAEVASIAVALTRAPKFLVAGAMGASDLSSPLKSAVVRSSGQVLLAANVVWRPNCA